MYVTNVISLMSLLIRYPMLLYLSNMIVVVAMVEFVFAIPVGFTIHVGLGSKSNVIVVVCHSVPNRVFFFQGLVISVTTV